MKLIQYITQEEFEKLFEATKDKKKKLAMLLGFEAGMRISEIVGLRPLISKCCKVELIMKKIERESDKKKLKHYFCSKCEKKLDWRKETRRSKEGWAIEPLTKDKIEELQIRISEGKGKKDRVVPRPKRMNDKSISFLPLKINRRTLEYHIKSLGKKLLNKDIKFHTLRHGFGSHLAGHGRPLHEIQLLMGHSRLDTTGIYLHANPAQAIRGASDVF